MGTTPAKKRGATAWALGLGGLAVTFFGAIAGPKFIKFQARSQQSEARANLKGLYIAQQGILHREGAYAADLLALGYQPERGNRFAYFLASEGPLQARTSAATPPLSAGLLGIARDTFKYGGGGPATYAETSCRLTSGKDPAGRTVGLGITSGEAGGFITAAAMKAEGKSTYSCWSIASMDRTTAAGETIAAGQPYCESSDCQ